MTETLAGKTLVVCPVCGTGQQNALITALQSKNLWTSETRYSSALPTRYYVYGDEHEHPLHRTARVNMADGKKIWQEYLSDGQWRRKQPRGHRIVPYHLPQILKASSDEIVFVVEGEKNADDVTTLGLVATTNPEGAGHWRKIFNRHLIGHLVVVIGDQDTKGEAHADAVVASLLEDGITVKRLRLPGLSEKGDVSDWIDTGGTREALLHLVDAASIVLPAPPMDERELERELDAIAEAAVRDTTKWSFKREGDDFRFLFPDKTRIWIRRVHERGDGLTGDVEVENAAYGRLDSGRLDLSSRSGQKGLIDKLDHKASGLGWEHHIEEVCYTVMQQVRRGEPEIRASDIALCPLRLGMSPWFPFGEPSILYGRGGQGKSLTMQTFSAAIVTTTALPGGIRPHPDLCGPLLYCDYETNDSTFRRRLSAVTHALQLDESHVLNTIFYRRMGSRLVTCGPEIRSIIARRRILTVVIDSWKLACGSNTTGDPGDVSSDAFAALRTFDCTALIVAHPPRQYDGDDSIPGVYGSIFNENFARSLVHLKRLGDPQDLEMRVVLQQTKENDLFRKSPIGLLFARERATNEMGDVYPRLIAVRSHDLTNEPDAQDTDWTKIRALIHREKRMLRAKEIAESLEMSESAVRSELSRHPKDVSSAPAPSGKHGEKVWGLVSTRQDAGYA